MNKKFITLLVIAGALLTNCSSRDEHDVTNSNSQENTQKPTPPKPSTPTDERPTDEQIGQRTYAQGWKVDKDTYLNNINIADLYNNNISNVLEGLKKSVEFVTFTSDQKYYILKDEELKDLTITKLEYDGQYITFYTRYKNIKSTTKRALEFNARDFYDKKITVNKSYVSTKYMRGIYELLNGAIGNLLSYDQQRYKIEPISNSNYSDDGNNTLRIGVKITDTQISDKFKTFEITKEIEGFKTLQNLADDLKIVYQPNFEKKAQTIIVKSSSNNYKDKLMKVFNDFWLRDKYITLHLNSASNKDALEIIDGKHLSQKVLSGKNIGHPDIYLEGVRFELTSAVLEGNNLKITIKLKKANDVDINKEYNFIIPNIKGIPIDTEKVINDPGNVA